MIAVLRRLFSIPTSTRAYDGAAGGRRTLSIGRFGRVNAEIGAAGQTLAARSAHLVENNPLIANGVANLVGETIGSGVRPSAAPRLVELFDGWAESADADGRTDFYGLQAAVVRDVAVRGEAFVLAVLTDDGFKLRQLDVDQVDRSLTRTIDGGTIVQGVEFDATGRRVAYWIAPSREDSFAGWAPPVRVNAGDVFHVFRPSFPGQVRGVPWTASVILAANELDKLCDALLMGASVAAMFAGFISDQNDVAGGEDAFGDDPQPSIEPGTLVRLKGGQTVTFATPQQAEAVTDLLKAQIRSLAAGLGVPAFMIDGDLTGANYSSLRAGLLPFRRRTEAFIYHCLVPQFLAPVWRRLMVLDGDPDARAEWIAPAPLQVDPAKAVEADLAEIRAGLSSRRQKVNERGWNVDTLDAEIAADKSREATLGLSFDAPTAKTPEVA